MEKFLRELDTVLEFPILLDKISGTLQAWNVKGLPPTYVVDDTSHIIYTAKGGRQMDSEHILGPLQGLLERKGFLYRHESGRQPTSGWSAARLAPTRTGSPLPEYPRLIEVRPLTHLILHVAAPGLLARLAFASRWRRAWALMMLTMVVDVDHLIAIPIYDPGRCGIGFHPLHSYPAIALYAVLAFIPRARIVAAGLLVHMGLDGLDCAWLLLS